MPLSNVKYTILTINIIATTKHAEKLKIGQATIACYENGHREPTINNLIAYADFFECTLDFIVGRADDFGNVTVRASKTEHGVDTLTVGEMNLLTKYRALKAGDKSKLEGYLDAITSR